MQESGGEKEAEKDDDEESRAPLSDVAGLETRAVFSQRVQVPNIRILVHGL